MCKVLHDIPLARCASVCTAKLLSLDIQVAEDVAALSCQSVMTEFHQNPFLKWILTSGILISSLGDGS